uniref:Uncharacterized protein n=1 Tax=Rhizophora mucronata TaxID=61149 RepID=A0A2P2KG31_RHIMU
MLFKNRFLCSSSLPTCETVIHKLISEE